MISPMRLANAPCSWGVLEFGLSEQVASWEQVLDEIAETGYAGTEMGDWGFLPTDAERLRAELSRRDLQMVGGFVPVAMAQPDALEGGIALALNTARLLAATGGKEAVLVLADDNGTVEERTRNAGHVTAELGLGEAQWAFFASAAQSIARQVRAETGLRTAFHHHCGGYVETPNEIARLMALTDPELLGLCLDTGHCLYGGGDPLALLRHYRSRVWHVHLKDMEPAVARRARQQGLNYYEAVAQGVFCELGRGGVPFADILEELGSMDYQGWLVVEQDVLPSLGTPRASAERNRAYLRGLGLS